MGITLGCPPGEEGSSPSRIAKYGDAMDYQAEIASLRKRIADVRKRLEGDAVIQNDIEEPKVNVETQQREASLNDLRNKLKRN
jgi:hypothetical protein